MTTEQKRFAFDQFHYEIGQIVFGRAAVEKASDKSVIQGGENLPFLTKPAKNKIGVRPAFDSNYK